MHRTTQALLREIVALLETPHGVSDLQQYVDTHGRVRGNAFYSGVAGALLDWHEARCPDAPRFLPTLPGLCWRSDEHGRKWVAEVLSAFDGKDGLIYYDRTERRPVIDDGCWLDVPVDVPSVSGGRGALKP